MATTALDMHIDHDKPDDRNTHATKRLWELIKDIRFAMLTTRHANGHLHARPMTTQNSRVDDDNALWFFMSRRSDPLDDLRAEPVVNVSYADPGKDAYVSVSGEARVVDDAAKKRELWSKMAEAWFPGGVDDPDLALVRVAIIHADYWETKDSKLVQMAKMVTAAATGRTPSGMGERQRVDMR